MSGRFTVKLLRCEHCGTQLPVTGGYVSFQCGACHEYWIISGDALVPLPVYRVALPGGFKDTPVFLPFWVIDVDGAELVGKIEASFAGLPGSGRDASASSDTEMSYLLTRIGGGTFRVFVPAFNAANTFAYIKIGKLLTARQPAFRVARQREADQPVLCALPPDEAIDLMDYIFISTLPESIQQSCDFLKDLRLEPSSAPRMVEFPFEKNGAFLKSLTCGFEISSRIVDGATAEKQAVR